MNRLNYIDESPLPEWGTGPDGRSTKLGSDTRLPALFQQWKEDACVHPSTVIVERKDSLGRPQFYRHCEHCGLKVSSAVAHAQAGKPSDYTPEYMDARNEGYTAERRASYDKLMSDAAERAQSGNRASYDDYLRSDAWRRRAAKILERAEGVCEGCLNNRATEVHHLTYAHVGHEFAFELVALCQICHDRIHEPS